MHIVPKVMTKKIRKQLQERNSEKKINEIKL